MYMYSKKNDYSEVRFLLLESYNGIINLLEVTNYLYMYDESRLSIAICFKCVRVYLT